MKKALSCFALAALAAAGPAAADLCTIEATPAATLLLPYFEVDIDNRDGVDTFFSINNAAEYSVLTHVIVWGDWSVEALDFNVYLTGYDVQTIGLGLIIRDGILPVTGDANSLSHRGSYSGPHPGSQSAVDLGTCASYMPYVNPALDPDFMAHLQSILTGGPSPFYNGKCGGYDFDDNIARGYVTVDVVRDCTLLTPCDPGYFTATDGTPYQGVGDYDNVLWGDWYMIDYANNFAQGDTLVHLEAAGLPAAPEAPEAPEGAGFGNGSFWNRCFNSTPGYDLREPLGTTYATRFYQNAAFDGGTDLIVWKDSQVSSARGYSCSNGPGWWPLPESQVVFFDEQENPETVCSISPCPQEDILFPNETNRVSIADLDVSPDSGWVYMNLNQNYGPVTFLAQAWVVAVHSAEGRFSAGLSAIQLDSFCDGTSILIGPYGDYPQSESVCNPFNGVGCALKTKSWN